MSDLRHQNREQLLVERQACEGRIKFHGSIWSGQRERLKWVNYYIDRLPRTDKQRIAELEARVADLEESVEKAQP